MTTEADTKPRISLRSLTGFEGEAGLLILAGHALADVPAAATRLNVVFPELLLGREYETCLPWHGIEDPFLSRRHARVWQTGVGSYCVCDLESTNGTWLDGVRISPGAHHKLRDGAVLMMGAHLFVFRRVTEEA